MAWSISHEGDLIAVAAAIRLRAEFVEDRADGMHDFQIGLLVPAADIVGLAGLAGFQHAADGAAVIAHIEPVADLLAVAVDRQALARQRIQDHQRDQFFRKMVRAVIVAAVRRQHRQSIGMVPGADQMVGGRLAGGIGAVRLIAVELVERRVILRQGAVDFIRRNMQKAETLLLVFRQAVPITTHRFQQVERADDIRLDEISRTVNGTIDMALGRKIDHRARPVHRQQIAHQLPVADIPVHEHMTIVATQPLQRIQIARIGQLVQIDHRLIMLHQPVKNKVPTNKTGTA